MQICDPRCNSSELHNWDSEIKLNDTLISWSAPLNPKFQIEAYFYTIEVAKPNRITKICFSRSYLSLTQTEKDNTQQSNCCTTTAAWKNMKMTEQRQGMRSLHYYVHQI